MPASIHTLNTKQTSLHHGEVHNHLLEKSAVILSSTVHYITCVCNITLSTFPLKTIVKQKIGFISRSTLMPVPLKSFQRHYNHHNDRLAQIKAVSSIFHSFSFLVGPVIETCPRPYLRVRETCKVGIEIEDDPVDGSRQSDSAHQQNDQHDVGEGGCEVSSLCRRETRRHLLELVPWLLGTTGLDEPAG